MLEVRVWGFDDEFLSKRSDTIVSLFFFLLSSSCLAYSLARYCTDVVLWSDTSDVPTDGPSAATMTGYYIPGGAMVRVSCI